MKNIKKSIEKVEAGIQELIDKFEVMYKQERMTLQTRSKDVSSNKKAQV